MPIELLIELPENSFPLVPLIGIHIAAYNEENAEKDAVARYIDHALMTPYLSHLVPEITSPECTLRAYVTYEHATRVEMRIVAHFANDESAMVFRIKHGMKNARSLWIKNATSEK